MNFPQNICTPWKASVFRVFLVRISPYSDGIEEVSHMGENIDQTNSEHGHFLRSVDIIAFKKVKDIY